MLNERLECDKYKEYDIASKSEALKDSEIKYALGLIARDYWYDNENCDLGEKIKKTVEDLSAHFNKLSCSKELQSKLKKNFLERKTPGDATFWSIIADGITKGKITNTMEVLEKEGYKLTESNNSILDKIIAYVYDTISNYQKDWRPPESDKEVKLTLEDLNRFNSVTLTICICQIILYYKCYKKYANKKNELIFVQEVFSRWCNIFSTMEKLLIKDNNKPRKARPETTLTAKAFINDILNECGISKKNSSNYLLIKVEIEELEENAKRHWEKLEENTKKQNEELEENAKKSKEAKKEEQASKKRNDNIHAIKVGKKNEKGEYIVKGIAKLLTN